MKGCSRAGAIWLPWLLILLMVSSLIAAYVLTKRSLESAAECAHNLENIFLALELYELDRGTLPELQFFPSDPLSNEASLVTVLADYGLESSHCVCPVTMNEVKEVGLSYIWNVNMNNRALDQLGEPEWLLMDIEATHPLTPGPHFRRVNILYSDGRVVRTHVIPPGVEVNLQ